MRYANQTEIQYKGRTIAIGWDHISYMWVYRWKGGEYQNKRTGLCNQDLADSEERAKKDVRSSIDSEGAE